MSPTPTPVATPPGPKKRIGAEARELKGFWRAHRWLLLRRLSQAGVLALFLLGPLAGVWIVKGNLSASVTLGVLPLTDPFVLAQSLAAGHAPALSALIGAAIVIVFYALAGGRAFCAWVCPVNLITDGAGWLRRRLDLSGGRAPNPRLRHWLLVAVLIVLGLGWFACAVVAIVKVLNGELYTYPGLQRFTKKM